MEPKRRFAHRVHPALRALAAWFLVGVFETFTEPLFDAAHDAIVWALELLARVLLGA